MRAKAVLTLVLLAVVDVAPAWSQVEIPSSQTSALPKLRPILLGNGADSLVNRIDIADLVRKGQKDAAIMFSCTVKKDGSVYSVQTYRGTADSKALEQEVLKKLLGRGEPEIHSRCL